MAWEENFRILLASLQHLALLSQAIAGYLILPWANKDHKGQSYKHGLGQVNSQLFDEAVYVAIQLNMFFSPNEESKPGSAVIQNKPDPYWFLTSLGQQYHLWPLYVWHCSIVEVCLITLPAALVTQASYGI